MEKNRLGTWLVLGAAWVAGQAFAQMEEGAWLVRVRAVNLASSNTDETGHSLGVNNKTFPAVDVSYFFTRNVAMEFFLTVPQEHTLYSGATRWGTFEQIPPTLMFQYHFDAVGFKPYMGVGVNYTQFSSVNLPGYSLDKDSYGAALQLGLDVPIARNFYLNLDVKKLYVNTKVYNAAGVGLGTFKMDPVLLGVGLGMRF